jgi:hypothetical protein
VKVLTAVNPIGWPAVGERCLDGEIVWIPPRCGRRGCSCVRAFAGCVTHGLTPTARVQQLDTSPDELFEMLAGTVCTNCWPPASIPGLAEMLRQLATRFPVGAVLARGPRGGVYALRPEPRSRSDE